MYPWQIEDLSAECTLIDIWCHFKHNIMQLVKVKHEQLTVALVLLT